MSEARFTRYLTDFVERMPSSSLRTALNDALLRDRQREINSASQEDVEGSNNRGETASILQNNLPPGAVFFPSDGTVRWSGVHFAPDVCYWAARLFRDYNMPLTVGFSWVYDRGVGVPRDLYSRRLPITLDGLTWTFGSGSVAVPQQIPLLEDAEDRRPIANEVTQRARIIAEEIGSDDCTVEWENGQVRSIRFCDSICTANRIDAAWWFMQRYAMPARVALAYVIELGTVQARLCSEDRRNIAIADDNGDTHDYIYHPVGNPEPASNPLPVSNREPASNAPTVAQEDVMRRPARRIALRATPPENMHDFTAVGRHYRENGLDVVEFVQGMETLYYVRQRLPDPQPGVELRQHIAGPFTNPAIAHEWAAKLLLI